MDDRGRSRDTYVALMISEKCAGSEKIRRMNLSNLISLISQKFTNL